MFGPKVQKKNFEKWKNFEFFFYKNNSQYNIWIVPTFGVPQITLEGSRDQNLRGGHKVQSRVNNLIHVHIALHRTLPWKKCRRLNLGMRRSWRMSWQDFRTRSRSWDPGRGPEDDVDEDAWRNNLPWAWPPIEAVSLNQILLECKYLLNVSKIGVDMLTIVINTTALLSFSLTLKYTKD